MSTLTNKIDFALLISATNANPNGDPLNGNRPRENYDGYGIVVWCDSEGSDKFWLVSIRENFTVDYWGREIIEDFTQTDSWEELEETVTNVLRKFYNKEV